MFQYLYLLGENVEDKEGLILPPASFARYAEAQDSFKAHYTSATADSRMPEACKFRYPILALWTQRHPRRDSRLAAEWGGQAEGSNAHRLPDSDFDYGGL